MRWQYVLTITIILYLLSRRWNDRITNITDQLPKHSNKVFPRRSKLQIEKIIVHHTAGPENQTPTEVARYHVGKNHVCAPRK